MGKKALSTECKIYLPDRPTQLIIYKKRDKKRRARKREGRFFRYQLGKNLVDSASQGALRAWICSRRILPSILTPDSPASNVSTSLPASSEHHFVVIAGSSSVVIPSSATRPFLIELSSAQVNSLLNSSNCPAVGGTHSRVRGAPTWLTRSVTTERRAFLQTRQTAHAIANQTQSPFLLQEQPTTSLALPPVVVQSKLPQYSHCTAVCE